MELIGVSLFVVGAASLAFWSRTKVVKKVVPDPPITYQRHVLVDVSIGDAPIDGVGWLGPDGIFHGNGGGNHVDCAFRLIDPHGIRDPNRNYELELENRRYLKLIRNVYYSGWTQPRQWHLSRVQREAVVNWYLMHRKPMPTWVQHLMDVGN